MAPTYRPHPIELFSTRFRDPDRRPIYARARLFPDRIDLVAWNPRGLDRRSLPLREVRRVEWNLEAKRAPNAVFHLDGGQTHALFLDRVHFWKDRLDDQLDWWHRTPEGPPDPEGDATLGELVAYVSRQG